MRCRVIWCLGAIIPVFAFSTMDWQRADALAAPLPQTTPASTPNGPGQNYPAKLLPILKDADGIPTALRQATETLFTQGVADPRSGEYRVITVPVGNVWQGNVAVVETHGWVLPGAVNGKRTAVCWNGLTYTVVEVKQPANLAADIQKRIEAHTEAVRKNGKGYDVIGWAGRAVPEATSLSLEHDALLKVVMLLRVDETNLARKLCTAWGVDAPLDANRPNEHRLDPYLTLAEQWAWSLYDRAVCAHIRGDDWRVSEDAVLLAHAYPLIEAEAKKRGYKTFPNGSVLVSANGEIPKEIETYLPFLNNIYDLYRDSQRRLAEEPRPPLDMAALKKLPQAERIAQLIARLDEINTRQSGQPGSVSLDANLIPNALVAEGDAAIEPLLEVLGNDTRLTRSVSFGRDFFPNRNLLTVKSVALSCFTRITQISPIQVEHHSLTFLQQWWEKNKNRTPPERWLMQLAYNRMTWPMDSTNESDEVRSRRERRRFEWENLVRLRWEESAARILERSDIGQPDKPLPAFKGESLRSRSNPSVTGLLHSRALELSQPTEGRWGFDFASGARFALMLYEWEPKGAQTLPILQAVMRNCLGFYKTLSREENGTDQFQLAGRIARLVTARLRLGDTAAVDEYRTWLHTVTPNYLGFESRSALYPLMRDYNNPQMQRLAEELFSVRNGQKNAWNQLLTVSDERGSIRVSELLASDLLHYPAFRTLVQRRLTDTTEAGTLSNEGVRWKDGIGESAPTNRKLPDIPQPLRTCDRAAMTLQSIAGIPLFDPYGSVAERDSQCATIAAYLTRYQGILGRMPTGERPLHTYDGDYSLFNYLGPIFPTLTHPATETDVRENRAIFSLKNPTARRVTDLPPFPILAQWHNDPDSETTDANGNKVRWSSGSIWQAEEVLVDGKWVRYYGYVGPHRIAKVPASEINLPGR